MRRLLAWIITTGLVAAPMAAAAAPGTPTDEASAPSLQARPRLGALVIDLTGELRQHFGAAPDRGVLVGRIDTGSTAAAAGVQVGDVIVEVDRRPVRSPDDVIAALATHRAGDRVDVVVVRQRASHTLSVTLQAGPPRPADLLRSLRGWPFDEWLRRLAPPDEPRCQA